VLSTASVDASVDYGSNFATVATFVYVIDRFSLEGEAIIVRLIVSVSTIFLEPTDLRDGIESRRRKSRSRVAFRVRRYG